MKCVIIGVGEMGAGDSNQLLSHAAVLNGHEHFDLKGIFDTNMTQLRNAESGWGVKGFSGFDDMMGEVKPDLVSICTPDDRHAFYLEQILSYTPKLVVLEKPISQNISESEVLAKRYALADIPVMVHYSRRYLPEYERIRDLCRQEPVIAATIRYAKGLKHNGCHAVDLMRLLFGEILHAQPLSIRSDHDMNDPSVTAFLELEYAHHGIIQALDDRFFTHFEVDIFTQSHRFLIDQDHRRLQVFEVRQATGIPPGKRLIVKETKSIYHGDSLKHLYQEAANFLIGESKLRFPLSEALSSERITNQIHHEAMRMHRHTVPI